jgi:hypothetical protein
MSRPVSVPEIASLALLWTCLGQWLCLKSKTAVTICFLVEREGLEPSTPAL